MIGWNELMSIIGQMFIGFVILRFAEYLLIGKKKEVKT